MMDSDDIQQSTPESPSLPPNDIESAGVTVPIGSNGQIDIDKLSSVATDQFLELWMIARFLRKDPYVAIDFEHMEPEERIFVDIWRKYSELTLHHRIERAAVSLLARTFEDRLVSWIPPLLRLIEAIRPVAAWPLLMQVVRDQEFSSAELERYYDLLWLRAAARYSDQTEISSEWRRLLDSDRYRSVAFQAILHHPFAAASQFAKYFRGLSMAARPIAADQFVTELVRDDVSTALKAIEMNWDSYQREEGLPGAIENALRSFDLSIKSREHEDIAPLSSPKGDRQSFASDRGVAAVASMRSSLYGPSFEELELRRRELEVRDREVRLREKELFDDPELRNALGRDLRWRPVSVGMVVGQLTGLLRRVYVTAAFLAILVVALSAMLQLSARSREQQVSEIRQIVVGLQDKLISNSGASARASDRDGGVNSARLVLADASVPSRLIPHAFSSDDPATYQTPFPQIHERDINLRLARFACEAGGPAWTCRLSGLRLLYGERLPDGGELPASPLAGRMIAIGCSRGDDESCRLLLGGVGRRAGWTRDPEVWSALRSWRTTGCGGDQEACRLARSLDGIHGTS